MHVGVLSGCISVHHLYAWSHGDQMSMSNSLGLEIQRDVC